MWPSNGQGKANAQPNVALPRLDLDGIMAFKSTPGVRPKENQNSSEMKSLLNSNSRRET